MRTSVMAIATLALWVSSATAQHRVAAVDETECFAPAPDGRLRPDSVPHVRLSLAGGDSLVLTWEPAIGIGTIGMERDGGTDIWWVQGSLKPPVTVGSEPPGAQDSEHFSRSALQPGTRFRVIVMDAADEDDVTWACTRLFAVEE